MDSFKLMFVYLGNDFHFVSFHNTISLQIIRNVNKKAIIRCHFEFRILPDPENDASTLESRERERERERVRESEIHYKSIKRINIRLTKRQN